VSARLARLPSPACHRPKIARSHGDLPAIATHAGIEPTTCTWRWQAGGGQASIFDFPAIMNRL